VPDVADEDAAADSFPPRSVRTAALSHPSRQTPLDPHRPAVPSVTQTRYGVLLKWTIPSVSERGHEVQSQILDEVARHKYNSDSVFAIKLALEEAVVNAIKHGNKFDAAKKVYVEALVGPDQMEVTIEDEGPGFQRSDVPDPTSPENLEKCSGRGILLIEHYMTSVDWANGGRRMHMVKRND
jgi:serine/threonine-protein kinase RsbW